MGTNLVRPGAVRFGYLPLLVSCHPPPPLPADPSAVLSKHHFLVSFLPFTANGGRSWPGSCPSGWSVRFPRKAKRKQAFGARRVCFVALGVWGEVSAVPDTTAGRGWAGNALRLSWEVQKAVESSPRLWGCDHSSRKKHNLVGSPEIYRSIKGVLSAKGAKDPHPRLILKRSGTCYLASQTQSSPTLPPDSLARVTV